MRFIALKTAKGMRINEIDAQKNNHYFSSYSRDSLYIRLQCDDNKN